MWRRRMGRVQPHHAIDFQVKKTGWLALNTRISLYKWRMGRSRDLKNANKYVTSKKNLNHTKTKRSHATQDMHPNDHIVQGTITRKFMLELRGAASVRDYEIRYRIFLWYLRAAPSSPGCKYLSVLDCFDWVDSACCVISLAQIFPDHAPLLVSSLLEGMQHEGNPLPNNIRPATKATQS